MHDDRYEVPGAGEVVVRRARREDVPGIVRLLADDDLGRQRETVTDPLPQCYLEAFEEIDDDPRQLLLVALLGRRVVATLQLTFLRNLAFGGGRRAQVESVRVASDLRGAGLGSWLLRRAVDRVADAGAHVVQLTTHASRDRARRFYESLGFVASHHGLKLHLDDGGAREAAQVAQWDRRDAALDS